LLEEFPSIVSMQADADEIPEIAGKYSIFTVPALLLFVNGKESIRKARFVRIGELGRELEKIVEHM
ncbi:thioredoxin family protein, partial [Staphylococcus epidermidis]|uniref:thioredoxin family protein n=1 Tax=Staphylococcus epidermidis TaxID=1282 RepID=UPI001C92E2F1